MTGPRIAVMQLPDGIVDGNPFGTQIIADDSVQFGDKFIVPRGSTYEQLIAILQRKMEDEETITEFSRTYHYRPMDGAYATFQCMKEMFGITRGKAIRKFFGNIPPEMVSVKIGPRETVQVPWGRMDIAPMEGGDLYMTETDHREYGQVYKLVAMVKRKYKAQIDELFDRVDSYLAENSIYRGKALIGHLEPEFLDLSEFDPEKVVYSEGVLRQLEATLWSVMRYTEALRRECIPRKRAALLYGPYGTGKTLAGQMTAWVATTQAQTPWTFIAARPGQDDLSDALQTARLYEPAVVFFEDVDETASRPTGSDEMTRLMDMFDGITAKGGEMMCVMTTNHIERIHKGMLRPGRLDALVEITHLDRAGIEKLIQVVVAPDRLDVNIDYPRVADAMEGFFPAFIAEVCHRASTVALARVHGKPDYHLSTDDLCIAAETLRPQFDRMEAAGEGQRPPALEEALSKLVKSAVASEVHEAAIVVGEEEYGHLEVASSPNGK